MSPLKVIYDNILDELDVTIPCKTFCVIKRINSKDFVYRFNASKSLWLFGPTNKFRKRCVQIVCSTYFDIFRLIVIAAHLGTYAYNHPFEYEIGFNTWYVLETFILIIARGFLWGPYTYLKNALNLLDSIYLAICLILFYTNAYIPLIYLRIFRVLEILTVLSSRFRIVLLTLVRASKNIIVVVGSLAFLIFVFANIGLKSFKGTLSNYCRLNPEVDLLEPHLVPSRRDYFIYHGKIFPCSSNGQCPTNYMCSREENREKLYFTFDNIFYSSLNVLRVIILDDFEDVYEKLLGVIPAGLVVVFFVPLIFFGSLVLYSTLMSVIITTSYDLELKIEIDILARSNRFAKAIRINLNDRYQKFVFVFGNQDNIVPKIYGSNNSLLIDSPDKLLHVNDWKSNYFTNPRGGQKHRRNTLVDKVMLNNSRAFSKDLTDDHVQICSDITTYHDPEAPVAKNFVPDAAVEKEVVVATATVPIIETGGVIFDSDKTGNFFTYYWKAPKSLNSVLASLYQPFDDDDDSNPNNIWRMMHVENTFSRKTRDFSQNIIGNAYFKGFMNLCIVLDVIIICTDHYPQPTWLYRLQYYSDMLFNLIFSVEFVLYRMHYDTKFIGLMTYTELLLNITGWIRIYYDLTYYNSPIGVEARSLLNVIKSIKIIRMVRLPMLNKLTMKLGDFMVTLLVYFVILFALLYIWSVIGFQLFHSHYKNIDPVENPFLNISRALVINIMILCGQIYRPIAQCLAETDSPASFCMAYFLGGVPIFSVMIFLFEGVLFHSMATTIKINEPLEPVVKLKHFLQTRVIVPLIKKLKKFSPPKVNFSDNDSPPRHNNSWLELFSILAIVSSCLLLLFEDIYYETSKYRIVILWISEILVIAHILMSLLKGYHHSRTFATLYQVYNIIILILLLLTYAPYVVEENRGRKLRKSLVFTRVLTLLAYSKQSKVVLETFKRTLNALFNSFILCFTIWLIFASIGVSLLKGMSYECVRNGREMNFNRTTCLYRGFEWRRRYVNFDNVLYSLDALHYLTLYQDIEGIVLAGIKSRGVELGSRGEPRLSVTFYFMLFLIGGSFFLFSLFLGVIFDTIKDMEVDKQQNIGMILTNYPKNDWYVSFYNKLRLVIAAKPVKPINELRKVFYKINLSSEYVKYCQIIILLNAIFISFDSYSLTEQKEDLLQAADMIFFTFFTTELILKVFVERWNFFVTLSNVFNFVALSLMLFGLFTANHLIHPYWYHMFLIGRLVQAVRIFEIFPKVHRIFKVTVAAMPSLFTIIAAHWYLILIYSCIGTFYFHDNLTQTYVYNHHFNFKTISHSMAILILMTTKTRIHEIEQNLIDPGNEDIADNIDYLLNKPKIFKGIVRTGTGLYLEKRFSFTKSTLTLYVNSFMIFNLIASMLYQAIMAEHFGYANEESIDDLKIKEDILDHFLISWDDVTNGKVYMNIHQLPNFLANLPEPLTIPDSVDPKLLAVFDLNIYKGNVMECEEIFSEVLKYYIHGLCGPNSPLCRYHQTIVSEFSEKFNAFYEVVVPRYLTTTTLTFIPSVIKIQKWWKRVRK